MQMLETAIGQKMEQKKLQVQKQRADAYDKMADAQTRQADMSARKLRAEMDKLKRQEAFLDKASSIPVKTTAGEMSMATAISLAKMGAPGLEITDDEWKYIDTITNSEGKPVNMMMHPRTGEVKEVEASFEEMPGASDGDLSKWESLEGKMGSMANHAAKLWGESDWQGLDLAVQDKVSDTGAVGATLLKENPEMTSTEAGRRAMQQTKRYYTALENIKEGDQASARKQIKQALKFATDIVSRAMKTNTDVTTTNFNKSFIEQQLKNKGFSDEQIETLFKQVISEIRNAK
jgi:hypothetical protein